MSESESEVFRYISDADVPESLVDKVLDKLREKPGLLRFSHNDWYALRDKKPNLHHFIEASSYEAAPDDPILREKVSAAMLGMVILSQEIQHSEGEERIIELLDTEFGDTINQILSTEPGPEELRSA